MSPQKFALEVGAWILPSDLSKAARRFETDPVGATSQMALRMMTNVLQSDRDGNLRAVIELFLENFRVSSPVIDLLPTLGFGILTRESRDWLRGLRFSGSLRSVNVGVTAELWPVLDVVERDAVIDILRNPLQMLTDSVNIAASQFKKARELGLNIYYRPTINSALGAFLESQVADAYGVPLSAPRVDFAPVFTYRALSLSIGTMPDAQVIKGMRDVARGGALLTLTPP